MDETSEGYLHFQEKAGERLSNTTASAMLSPKIKEDFDKGTHRFSNIDGVAELAKGKEGKLMNCGLPQIFTTSASVYLDHKELSEEVFGPSSLFVKARSKDEIIQLAENLEGHLTATIHGTEEDLQEYATLVDILERKVGRIIINGFPTGVEVCHSMIHGGPFPATTDSRTTSVGTLAIYRFTRPVCYQGFSQEMLPDELKDSNPLSLFRLVNGKVTQDRI